jgi:hypothetical protein
MFFQFILYATSIADIAAHNSAWKDEAIPKGSAKQYNKSASWFLKTPPQPAKPGFPLKAPS